jgi:O-methyltransferase
MAEKIRKILCKAGYGVYRKPQTANSSFGFMGYKVFKIPGYGKGNRYFPYLLHTYFRSLYEKIIGIEGEIVECGVGYGATFLILAWLSYTNKDGRTVWGFDSFEGFPAPTLFDQSPRNPQKGQWNVSSIQDIEQKLTTQGGIDPMHIKRHVKLVKGFFNESVAKYRGGPIALLHLDVDLYESYRTTLEYFWPKVAKGGVVLFDEYRQAEALIKFPGAQKAIDEYFGDLKNEIRLDPTVDRYYLIKR